ncbi:MAG: hypothetical protein IPJ68_05640 [Candidatus Moraniibacteriota bacterium]|nr:MAG: hypothetical protein IPJ68_05640 [Candidatus Moranbacteria bacterium]
MPKENFIPPQQPVPNPYEVAKENFARIDANSFEDMLDTHNPYSETLLIEPDGKFARLRQDGVPKFVDEDTPASLYTMAQRVETKFPHLKFTFDRDPQGKWMRYTVTRSQK